MSEFDLIKAIRDRLGGPGLGTLIGPGDDAAVYEPPGVLELLTCDAFVEGVHFLTEHSSFRDIGAKCMVANISDVAAMGGVPSKAVVSLCVPPYVSESDVTEFFEGALEVCEAYGAEIVGGDIVSSQSAFMVSVALVGAVDSDRVITRSGAVPGDALVVTGELGGSEVGLLSMKAGLPRDEDVDSARQRHLRPVPRVAEARAVMQVATPHAMIDLSDGLSSDLLHIADESGVGVVLESSLIPIAACATAVSDRLGQDPVEMALGSGEEFELLIALPESETDRASEHVMAVTGTRLTRIGYVTAAGEGRNLLRTDGSTVALVPSGYEHLSGS